VKRDESAAGCLLIVAAIVALGMAALALAVRCR